MTIQKPWQALSQAQTPAKMGVFELGDETGDVLFVSYAGGRSTHGLQGAVATASQVCQQATQLRFEVTTAYLSRYRELMMWHVARSGVAPETDKNDSYGRLSPGGTPTL